MIKIPKALIIKKITSLILAEHLNTGFPLVNGSHSKLFGSDGHSLCLM